MKTNILGINVDTLTYKESMDLLLTFLETNKNHMLVTPNPECIMLSRKDNEYKNIINSSDLVAPDGIGVVYASKLNNIKITERVAGCDLVHSLFEEIKNTQYTVYLLGASTDVAVKAKSRMEKKFPGLKIVGTHDGYFDEQEEKNIINEINFLKPDILVIGMSMVKQEKWAYKYKDTLPVKIMACVGGTIDVMSGNVQRAPKFYIDRNLEWLYRLKKEPKRFFRMLRLPLFVIVVLIDKIIGSNTNSN